jgi:ADP-heptose:LPS heptosyltransferase
MAATTAETFCWLMPALRNNKLRRRVYDWRQRRPLKRALAIISLAVVSPVIWIARSLQRSSADPHKILVIHFGGLGDTLMLTPALRALKQRYPQAQVDLITLHEHVSSAFRGLSSLDSILVLPPYAGQWIVSRFATLSGARLIAGTIRYYPELLLKLAFTRYDLAINFGLADFDCRVGSGLMRSVNIPTRIGLTGSPFVTKPVPSDRLRQHRADAYSSFLEALGITKSQSDYEYPVAADDLEHVKRVLRDRRIDQARPLAVIHPGGKLHVNSRRWPAEYYARVCDFLSGEGFEVVLTGDGDDAVACDEVAKSMRAKVVSVCGELTFAQTAALLNLSDVVVTNDTATPHLAEAVKAPRVISIFGPTDPALLAPQSDRHLVFRSSLPCAPCMGGTIGAATERCWRDVKEECLWQTTPDQVIKVLRELYGKRATRVASA